MASSVALPLYFTVLEPVAHAAHTALPLTLVCIHGHGSASDTYAALAAAPELADTRRVLVDLRGHGRSPLPAVDAGAEAWGRPAFAADVQAVLASFDGAKVLVGHSMGVRVAVEAVAQDPRCVDSLVCIDMDTKARKPDALFLSKEPGAKVAAAAFTQGFPTVEAAKAALVSHGYEEGRVDAAVASGRVHRLEDGSWWSGLHPHTFYMTAGADGPLVPCLRSAWEAVAAADWVPVSLLLAAKGSAASGEEVEWMQAAMPRLDVHTVPHTHHSVHRDDTPATAKHIAAVCAEVRRRRTLGGGSPP